MLAGMLVDGQIEAWAEQTGIAGEDVAGDIVSKDRDRRVPHLAGVPKLCLQAEPRLLLEIGVADLLGVRCKVRSSRV